MSSRESWRDVSFQVGDCRVEPALNQLSRDGEVVHLRPQVCDLLVFFAQHPNEVLSKQQIFAAAWPGEFVSESALKATVAELRHALGDTGHESRVIENIAKRGYRLIAPVSATSASAVSTTVSAAVATPERPAPEPQTGSRPRRATTITTAVVVVAGVAASLTWWRVTRPRPVMADGIRILVADFVNKTGDEVFDGTLKQAVRIGFEQSPAFRVVSTERIRQTLKEMTRSPDDLVVGAVAREVCERAGAAVVLNGSIATLGKRYAVGLEATDCTSGDVLAEQQQESTGREQILDVLGRATSEIRRRLGESTTSVRRFDVPIAQATTASLEALRAFSLAQQVNAAQGQIAAEALVARAVKLDPDFAMAHVALSTIYWNTQRLELSEREAREAYARRDRVTERERLAIDIRVCVSVPGNDPDCFPKLNESLKRMYPYGASAYTNLCYTYGVRGDYDRSLPNCRDAVRLEPEHSIAYDNLAGNLTEAGRFAEAKRVLDTAAAHHIDAQRLNQARFRIAFATGDSAAMNTARTAARGSPEEFRLARDDADAAMFEGRVKDARLLLARAVHLTNGRFPEWVAEQRSVSNRFDAAIGLRPCRITTALPISQLDAAERLTTALLCDDDGAAQRVLSDIATTPRLVRYETIALVGSAQAILALREGDRGEMLRTTPVPPVGTGFVAAYRPQYLRGVAWLRAGEGRAAATEFQWIIDRRGLAATSPLYPLAHVQQARAYALAGDAVKARAAYEAFFNLWAHADSDVPILAAARAEYSRLVAAAPSGPNSATR